MELTKLDCYQLNLVSNLEDNNRYPESKIFRFGIIMLAGLPV